MKGHHWCYTPVQLVNDKYVCQGANSYGQLGQGDEEDQAVPRLSNVNALRDRTVRTVRGGGGHTVVVCGRYLNLP